MNGAKDLIFSMVAFWSTFLVLIGLMLLAEPIIDGFKIGWAYTGCCSHDKSSRLIYFFIWKFLSKNVFVYFFWYKNQFWYSMAGNNESQVLCNKYSFEFFFHCVFEISTHCRHCSINVTFVVHCTQLKGQENFSYFFLSQIHFLSLDSVR